MVEPSLIAKNVQDENSFGKRKIDLRAFISGRRHYLLAKRIFDLAISAFVLLFIFSWLFPILYLLIRLDSKGPVFFIQKRVGFLGRTFPCLKFRTMHLNAEANTKQATDDDPRITGSGAFCAIPIWTSFLSSSMSWLVI